MDKITKDFFQKLYDDLKKEVEQLKKEVYILKCHKYGVEPYKDTLPYNLNKKTGV